MANLQMAVDLLLLPVALKKMPQNARPSHPDKLLRHPGVLRAVTLSQARVTSLPSGLQLLASAETRLNRVGLADDETVLDEAANILSGISVGNLVGLAWIEPDLALAALENGGGESFLKAQVRHWSQLALKDAGQTV